MTPDARLRVRMLSVLVCRTRSAPGLEGRFQDVDRADVVHGLEFPSIPHPEVGIGRQVVDPPAAPQGFGECLAFTNVCKDDLDTVGQMADLRAGPFDDSDSLPGIGKLLHQMAADEPCTSRNDHCIAHGIIQPLRNR